MSNHIVDPNNTSQPPSKNMLPQSQCKDGSVNQNLPYFNSYLAASEVEVYLQTGSVIQGALRINPRNYEEAYINAPDASMDIYIGGIFDRNAALHGDVVGISLLPVEKWKVLLDNLDSFLEEKPELKNLLFSSIGGIKSSSETAFKQHTNDSLTDGVDSRINNEDVQKKEKDLGSPQKDECDPKKRRRKGRGKKKRIKDKEKLKLKDDSKVVTQPSTMSALSTQIPPIELISSESASIPIELSLADTGTVDDPSLPFGECLPQSDDPPSKEALQCDPLSLTCHSNDDIHDGIIIVPPDELSECDDLTDDDSGCSQICDEDDVVDKRFLPKIDRMFIHKKKPSDSTEDTVGVYDPPIERAKSPPIERAKSPPTQHLPPLHNLLDSEKNPIEFINYHHKILVDYVEEEVRRLGLSHLCPTNKQGKDDNSFASEVRIPISVNHLNQEKSMNDKSIGSNSSMDAELIDSCSKIEQNSRNSSHYNPKGSHRVDNGSKKTQKNLSALEVVRLVPNWERFVQRRGVVVYIFEKNHTRMGAGLLKPFGKMNNNFALFSPTDGRIPRMRIPINECPKDFLKMYKDYSKTIFLANIVEWKLPGFALGGLVKTIGCVGELSVELEALLLENGVDYEPFPKELLDTLPTLPWTIPSEEISLRTDLRSSCIFSIDPESARDLDDAISCLKLPSGNLRVGVHIADVSHFIKVGSSLDELASCRGTSIYLPDKVIPMLPPQMCEQLCSLNPGEDRLAISVIWELSPSGEILGEWFGKTVIRSCSKLSYDHAQAMIENNFEKLIAEEFPIISNGFNLTHIYEVIQELNKLAVILRKKRADDGALRLDQVKLHFNIDPITKTPNGISIFEHKDSNKLIEEFMLLANMFVAKRIYQHFPILSVLRHHPNPHKIPMENTINFLIQNGIHLNGQTAGTLNDSINKYKGSDDFSVARMQLIVNLCSKPMQYARYFCTGVVKDPIHFHHYALNVPFYTHFTSPIRRYPDIMVHRLLSASVHPNRYAQPKLAPNAIQKICANCNKQKQTSKVVQESSSELFMAEFVRQAGELIENGMVIGVLDRSVDIYLLRLGIIKRCYMERLELKNFLNVPEKKTIYLEWGSDEAKGILPLTQALTFFTLVQVMLKPFDNNSLKFNALVLRPDL